VPFALSVRAMSLARTVRWSQNARDARAQKVRHWTSPQLSHPYPVRPMLQPLNVP
jgi:hypothetical protein